MTKCKLCNSTNISVYYRGKIRKTLTPFTLTHEDVDIIKCNDCQVLFHDYQLPEHYYTSPEYRTSLESSNDIATHYQKHDGDVLQKLSCTGTDIFRGKVAADIGTGGGSFIDFLMGVADKTIAVEPNENFRKEMAKKGHATYDYVSSAINAGIHCDIVTSFDVIEHVADPLSWVKEIYDFLKPGGSFICATCNDYPLWLKYCSEKFTQKVVYLNVHPWIFTEDSLTYLFEKAGFQNIKIEQKMRYGISNFVHWLSQEKGIGHTKLPEFSETLDSVFRSEMIAKGLGDWLVVKAYK